MGRNKIKLYLREEKKKIAALIKAGQEKIEAGVLPK